jgi:IS30 family transposase
MNVHHSTFDQGAKLSHAELRRLPQGYFTDAEAAIERALNQQFERR